MNASQRIAEREKEGEGREEPGEDTLPGIGPEPDRFRVLRELDWDELDEERIFKREANGVLTPVSSSIRLAARQRAASQLELEPEISSLEKALRRRSWLFMEVHVRPFFRWYDMWVGAYWDKRTRTLYVCPIPMFGVRIIFGKEHS